MEQITDKGKFPKNAPKKEMYIDKGAFTLTASDLENINKKNYT